MRKLASGNEGMYETCAGELFYMRKLASIHKRNYMYNEHVELLETTCVGAFQAFSACHAISCISITMYKQSVVINFAAFVYGTPEIALQRYNSGQFLEPLYF